MSEQQNKVSQSKGGNFLRTLARDQSGNTLALIAAAIFPLLGLVGSGIDMSRAYLASSRLQAACDAGVLAARKSLGTQAIVDGKVPENVATTGRRFFNLNFRDGNYGTESRNFEMTLEQDFAISGVASVDVPTSIMGVFGYDEVPVSVDCNAVLSVSDLDVMMVLDVTGSMRHTNVGDPLTRMESMKQVIRNFHAQLEAAKSPDSRIRYGFVPYATNVNVGHLLADDWVTDQWTYQSREDAGSTEFTSPGTSSINFQYVSGTKGTWEVESTYSTADGACDQVLPPESYTSTNTEISSVSSPFAGPPAGTQTHAEMEKLENGDKYRVVLNGTQCEVQKLSYDNYLQTYTNWTRPYNFTSSQYLYKPISMEVSDWRATLPGCIEERATTEITDYLNVDFNQNLDLNIDLVPTAGNPETQWKPFNPSVIYARSFYDHGTGSFTKEEKLTAHTYSKTGTWWFSSCPAKAQKLQEMTTDEVDTYLATLAPYGATYHDIGMIWGARLMSPTGLYASENADVTGSPKTRHMVFLTDGQTEPYDLAYGAYGLEGLDERRWTPASPITLAETVEARFGVVCSEAKKRNITVWVIAFGTYLNDSMVECAGNGRYFEAASASDLNDAFSSIAKSIGDLRIQK
ncbi:hypothetical protein GCM10023115_17060 [Pontixanthobacter gangjinensis]|uniref:Putative Flp pilus-assembly TadG-like N-terminal domain-containing protein n=1 Tax=Pontixanthobacter gangjinensis TaxID=1028742 RepID=A0A6I4SP87_9SPHN|nr:TadE/TadG family protein [Pontixanthobacter gangjinensis]MXO56950.1 hypothetical protein [Pontixanthobacter gangjinensis]